MVHGSRWDMWLKSDWWDSNRRQANACSLPGSSNVHSLKTIGSERGALGKFPKETLYTSSSWITTYFSSVPNSAFTLAYLSFQYDCHSQNPFNSHLVARECLETEEIWTDDFQFQFQSFQTVGRKPQIPQIPHLSHGIQVWDFNSYVFHIPRSPSPTNHSPWKIVKQWSMASILGAWGERFLSLCHHLDTSLNK